MTARVDHTPANQIPVNDQLREQGSPLLPMQMDRGHPAARASLNLVAALFDLLPSGKELVKVQEQESVDDEPARSWDEKGSLRRYLRTREGGLRPTVWGQTSPVIK